MSNVVDIVTVLVALAPAEFAIAVGMIGAPVGRRTT
jgi:hypothetical protein